MYTHTHSCTHSHKQLGSSVVNVTDVSTEHHGIYIYTVNTKIKVVGLTGISE